MSDFYTYKICEACHELRNNGGMLKTEPIDYEVSSYVQEEEGKCVECEKVVPYTYNTRYCVYSRREY